MKGQEIIFKLMAGVGSLVLGGIAVYLIVKKHDEEYWGSEDEESRYTDLGDIEDEEEVIINPENGGKTVASEYTASNDIKEKLLKNWDKPDLHELANNIKNEKDDPVDEDMDEEEIDEEDEEIEKTSEELLEERLEDEALEADRFHRENKDRAPEIISEDDVNNGRYPSEYEIDEWIYWALDGIVTDEDGGVIAGPSDFVGDLLESTGFSDVENTDADDIYVISYAFDTIYHITKYHKSYKPDAIAAIALENGYVVNENDGDVG